MVECWKCRSGFQCAGTTISTCTNHYLLTLNTATAHLPILDALPSLLEALRQRASVVLQAPPGAGKSTGVPLALLDAKLSTGKILMLEPRRIAARSVAQRMANTLGEPVGQ